MTLFTMKRLALALLGTYCLTTLTEATSRRRLPGGREYLQAKYAAIPTSEEIGQIRPAFRRNGSAGGPGVRLAKAEKGKEVRTEIQPTISRHDKIAKIGKIANILKGISNLGPTQKDLDLALTKSILFVLYRFKDTYNDTNHWKKTYFEGKNGVIKQMEKDLKDLRDWKSGTAKLVDIEKAYGISGVHVKGEFTYKRSELMKLLESSIKSAKEHWEHHNAKMQCILNAFGHFVMYEDDHDYRTDAAKYFRTATLVFKVAYAVTLGALGAGGAIGVAGRDFANEVWDHLNLGCNLTKDLDLVKACAEQTYDLITDHISESGFGAAALHKAISGKDDTLGNGKYMNYCVNMDMPGCMAGIKPIKNLKEWIDTYSDVRGQLETRELSEFERAHQLDNRFRLQNLLSERTLPPQGVRFEKGSTVDKEIEQTYVERFVFVAHPKKDKLKVDDDMFAHVVQGFTITGTEIRLEAGHEVTVKKKTFVEGQDVTIYYNTKKGADRKSDRKQKLILKWAGWTKYFQWINIENQKAIDNFEQMYRRKDELKLKSHTYLDFNQYTKGRTTLVGVMEFKKPTRLNAEVKKYTDTLMRTHNFTIYHLGNGNVGSKCSSEEEQAWIPTRDWQTLPVIKKHIRRPVEVPVDTNKLDDLEIFRRAAIRSHSMLTPSGSGALPLEFTREGIYAEEETGVSEKKPFGAPCEFKTQAFTKPFKFYTKYVEGLKEIYGDIGFKKGNVVAINGNYHINGKSYEKGDKATISAVNKDNIHITITLPQGDLRVLRRDEVTPRDGFKLNHHTRVIRTIHDCDILNKGSVELKRFQTLELLKNQAVLKSEL